MLEVVGWIGVVFALLLGGGLVAAGIVSRELSDDARWTLIVQGGVAGVVLGVQALLLVGFARIIGYLAETTRLLRRADAGR